MLNGFLWLGFELLQFLGKGNAIQQFRVYLHGSEGGMWLISAQLKVVPVQLAFRFPTNAETRQLIPGQWEDYIKWSPLAWL